MTIITRYATQDTFYDGGEPDTTHGSLTSAYTRYTGNRYAAILLKFDLTGITLISSCKLVLNALACTNSESTYDLYVMGVDPDTWDESTLTTNNDETDWVGIAIKPNIPTITSPTTIEIDVTYIVSPFAGKICSIAIDTDNSTTSWDYGLVIGTKEGGNPAALVISDDPPAEYPIDAPPVDYSMGYNEWPERVQYRINDYPGSGYVCQFNLNWLPGMAGDFRDVRFSDRLDSKLSYWIESYTAFGSATVHVKLGNSPTVFLHYGNGSAVSESSGTNTFDFFDDFSGSTLDTSKWTAPTGTWAVANGKVTKSVSSTSGYGYSSVLVATGGSTADNVVFRVSWKYRTAGGVNSGIQIGVKVPSSGTTTGYYAGFDINTLTPKWLKGNVAWYDQIDSLTFTVNSVITSEITYDGTNVLYRHGSGSWNSYAMSGFEGYFGINNSGSNGGTNTVEIDWVFSRPYLATEPTAVLVAGGHKVNTVLVSEIPPDPVKHAVINLPRVSVDVTAEKIGYDSVGVAHENGPRSKTSVYREWPEVVRYSITNHPGAGYDCIFTIPWKPRMRSDFVDIRFSDGKGAALSYWVESYSASLTATVFVKLSASETVFLHYGNASAVSESNGNNVFDFFDDFSGTTLDTNKWVKTGTATLSNGTLVLGASNSNVRGLNTFNPTVYEYVSKVKTSSYSSARDALVNITTGSLPGTGYAYEASGGFTSGDLTLLTIQQMVAMGTTPVPNVVNNNEYYIWKIRKVGSTYYLTVTDSVGNVGTASSSQYSTTGTTYYFWIMRHSSDTTTITAEYAYLRKYVATEPIATVVSSPGVSDLQKFVTALKSLIAYNRESSLNIPEIKEYTCKHERRDSCFYLPIASEYSSRSATAFDRSPNLKVDDVRLSDTWGGTFSRSTYSSIPILATIGYNGINWEAMVLSSIPISGIWGTWVLHLERPADSSVPAPGLYDERILHSERQTDNPVCQPNEYIERALVFARPATCPITISKLGNSRIYGQYRPADMSVQILTLSDKRILHLERPALFLVSPKLYAARQFALIRDSLAFIPGLALSDTRILAFPREADMPTGPVEQDDGVVLYSIREAAAYIRQFYTSGSITLGSTRLLFCNIPSPAESLKPHSVLFREADLLAGTPNHWISRDLPLVRDVGCLVFPVELNTLPGYGRFREAYCKIRDGQPGMFTETLYGMIRSASVSVFPEMFVDRTTGSVRETTIGVPVCLVLVSQKGNLDALSISSVTVPGLSAVTSVSLARMSLSDIAGMYIIAGDWLTISDPTEITLSKLPFYCELDKPAFYTEVRKPAYYVELWSETDMHEITQYDTDSFFGTLYDTDPFTKEKRLFPLSGCIIKAMLKGGVPDTTIVKDCIVLSDGQVRIDLTSADTAIPGMYTVKFLITGAGFRKELPEKREDVETIRVNDATNPI